MSRRKVPQTTVSSETPAIGATKHARVELATEREAKERRERIRGKWRSMQSSWFEMGKEVKEGLDKQDPRVLGMNAHEWMLDLFGEIASVSKIHRALRIARALEKIPEEKVKLLTEGNAYALTLLPESMRLSEEWIERATAEKKTEFERSVQSALEAKGHPPKEKRVHIGATVEESIAAQWDEAEKKVAGILNLDIELKPGLRAQVFEAIAALINTTDETLLKTEMVGGEPQAA